MWTFRKRFRGYDKGDELHEGEVSDAQIALWRKLGAIEQSGISLDNTKKEIMEYLDDNGIEYKKSMRKAELIELV